MSDQNLTDAALDREITRAMTVDPSPEFVARVRQHITLQPVPRAWTSRSWMAVATGAAVAAVLIFVASSRGQRTTRSSMPLLPAYAIARANVLVAMPGTRMLEPGQVARLTLGSLQPLPALATRAEPEIIIDPREARAIRLFMDRVVSGRLDLTPLLGASGAPILDVVPLPGIDIAPIVLSPLTQEGVPQ